MSLHLNWMVHMNVVYATFFNDTSCRKWWTNECTGMIAFVVIQILNGPLVTKVDGKLPCVRLCCCRLTCSLALELSSSLSEFVLQIGWRVMQAWITRHNEVVHEAWYSRYPMSWKENFLINTILLIGYGTRWHESSKI